MIIIIIISFIFVVAIITATYSTNFYYINVVIIIIITITNIIFSSGNACNNFVWVDTTYLLNIQPILKFKPLSYYSVM